MEKLSQGITGRLWNRPIVALLVCTLGTLLLTPACQKAQRTASEQLAGQQAEQRTYASPEDAGAALVAAARAPDRSP